MAPCLIRMAHVVADCSAAGGLSMYWQSHLVAYKLRRRDNKALGIRGDLPFPPSLSVVTRRKGLDLHVTASLSR